MSELGEFWRDVGPELKKQALERREVQHDNNDSVLQLWERQGVSIVRHTDFHYTLSKGSVVVDFWPSKTKWHCRDGGGSGGHSYGLKKLAALFQIQ